jgi:ribosomal protein S18 acetylase RimI-like enzyme
VLARRGFETEPFLYLSRDIAGDEPVNDSLVLSPTTPFRLKAEATQEKLIAASWHRGDLDPAAELLRAVYRRETAKYFAPGHTSAAWSRYLRNLVEQTGVGQFNPDATRILRGSSGIEALAIITTVSNETAHLAQVAVHPSRRRAGLAKRLVLDASAVAGRQGYTRITLLVGASNTAARRLYEDLGFAEGPRFVAAYRGVTPTRA